MSLLTIALIFLIYLIIFYFLKKRTNGPMNSIKKDLTGKLIIITGASDGIGVETAKDLLNANAKVIFACRNKEKTEKVINQLEESAKKNAIFLKLDLESFKSIETFANEIRKNYQKIDILINNAGMGAEKISKTEDGFVNVFQVNYLGNALLTLLLLDHFNDKESKIINVASRAYKWSKLNYGDSKILNNYELMQESHSKLRNKHNFYSDTKLLLVYFTQYLADVLENKYAHIKIVCLHPGVIHTGFIKPKNLIQKIFIILFIDGLFNFAIKDVVHGAQTTLFLSYSDNKDLVNGGYYNYFLSWKIM